MIMFRKGFPGGSAVKDLPAMQETQEMWIRSLGQKGGHGTYCSITPGGGHGTHSSILAQKMIGTKEPDGLYSIGLKKVRHN